MFMTMLIVGLGFVCVVLSLVAWGWLISIASREGETLFAIAGFLVPPLVLVYALTNYQAAKTPFWMLVGSIGFIGIMQVLVGAIA